MNKPTPDTNNIHFLLGQLEMAIEIVDQYQSYKTPEMKRGLSEAKARRSEVIRNLNKLANTALIIPRSESAADAD